MDLLWRLVELPTHILCRIFVFKGEQVMLDWISSEMTVPRSTRRAWYKRLREKTSGNEFWQMLLMCRCGLDPVATAPPSREQLVAASRTTDMLLLLADVRAGKVNWHEAYWHQYLTERCHANTMRTLESREYIAHIPPAMTLVSLNHGATWSLEPVSAIYEGCWLVPPQGMVQRCCQLAPAVRNRAWVLNRLWQSYTPISKYSAPDAQLAALFAHMQRGAPMVDFDWVRLRVAFDNAPFAIWHNGEYCTVH